MFGTLVVRCQARGKFPVYTVAFLPFERGKADPPELRFQGDLAVLKALETFVTTPARLLEAIKRLRDEDLASIPDVVLSRAQMSRFGLRRAVSGPKCARCSSQAQIVESRKRIRESKSVIEKTRARFERADPTLFELADRICRVCLNVIQPSDRVSGHGPSPIHAQCDDTTQPARDPNSPTATPPLRTDRNTE